MVQHWRAILSVLTVIATLSTCGPSPARAEEQRAASTQANGERRQDLIKRFDKDGDGRLNTEEREAARQEVQKRTPQQNRDQKVPAGVKALRDVEYARMDDKPLLLDLYLPEHAPKPMPVIVFIHGGAWRAGDKTRCPALPLTEKGFAAVSVNYRLTDKATFPAQIFDCKGAIRWVRANARKYRFDPERIGVWGSSAGGHLVALLGTSGGVRELEGDVGGNLEYSSRVQAVVDFCGPSSFLLEDLKGLEGTAEGKTPDAVAALLGGTVQQKPELARLASPVAHVTPDDPPFLIAHGEKDNVVPVQQARILKAALDKAGVEAILLIDPAAGHGIGTPDILKKTMQFLESHLNGKRTPAATKPAR